MSEITSLGRNAGIPELLEREYGEWDWELAWRLVPQVETYRVSRGDEVRFIKIATEGWEPDLRDEAARMLWARQHLPVPEVLDLGTDGRTRWLVTRGLPGHDATHPSRLDDPETTVRLLAEGLRRFHEAPVERCPFDFRNERALAIVQHRLERGRIDPARDFHDVHAHLTAEDAVAVLRATVPTETDVVVCHGDYCFPNALLEDGEVTGYVDLGELGVADRWWDLAVASWSVTWNVGPGHEERFLQAYGVTPDPERIAFYRLLYDLVS